MKRIIAMMVICGLADVAFSQNFGIDVANPEAKLHVQRLAVINQATVYVDQYANNSWGHIMKLRTHTSGGDGPKLLFINRDIKNWSIGGQESGNGFGIYEDGGDGVHGTGFGSPRLFLAAGGNVGIGTTSPSGKLHVAGNHSSGVMVDGNDRPSIAATGVYPQMVMMSGNSGNGNHGATLMLGGYDNGASGNHKHWSIGTSGANSTFLDIGYHNGTDLNPHAGIRNYNGSTFMTILNNGNVGLGTTSPGYRLHVVGNANFSRDNSTECCNNTGDYTISIAEATSTTGRTSTIQFHNGGVSEGYLRLANGGQRRIQFGDHQGVLMGVQSTGFMSAPSFQVTSDARLKENVTTITGALTMISSMRGVRYTWKKDSEYYKGGMTGKDVGVIAQEVERVLPEAIAEIEKGGDKSVAYDKLVPVLIEAVKEQQQLIKKLEQRIAALESN